VTGQFLARRECGQYGLDLGYLLRLKVDCSGRHASGPCQNHVGFTLMATAIIQSREKQRAKRLTKT
jgi:hypothetical protein